VNASEKLARRILEECPDLTHVTFYPKRNSKSDLDSSWEATFSRLPLPSYVKISSDYSISACLKAKTLLFSKVDLAHYKIKPQ